MKNIFIGTALAGALILITPGLPGYSQPPVFANSDYEIAQVNQAVELPNPVSEGLAFYKVGKMEAAVNYWLDNMLALIKDLPAEPGQEAAKKEEAIWAIHQYRPAMVMMFTSINQRYGAYKGYKVIKSIPRTNNILTTYLEIQHEKGSVFMEFITLKTEKGWGILHFHLSPDIEDIFK